jgi:hypothetical protein
MEFNQANSGKKGITGIYMTGVNNSVSIGPNNSFEGGLYGIYADVSNLTVTENNSFLNISGSLIASTPATAIKIIGNKILRTISIKEINTFNSCQRAIYSRGSFNFTAINNVFYKSFETAISVTQNKWGSASVGSGKISILDNKFNFCNWEAINLFDNGNSSIYKTNIEIKGNIIENQPYASGIVIQEISLSTFRPFGVLQIYENFIGSNSPGTKIGQAIIIRNVRGGEINLVFGNTRNKLGDIFSNKIFYTTTLNLNYSGIVIDNSKGISTQINELTGDNKTSNANSGLSISNSQECSVTENMFYDCGNGMKATINNNNSNYFCNKFFNNRNGINLRDGHILRPTGQVHGICGLEARDNKFNLSLNSDINRTTNTNPNRNKWVFPAINAYRLSTESNGGSFLGGDIIAPCLAPIKCEAAFTEPTISDPSVENSFPDAYVWNLQMKQMQEIMAENLPFDGQSNIVKIIQIGDYIANGYFDSAQLILLNLIPVNDVETDYYSLYNLIVSVNYPEERPYSEEEISFIRNLASLSTYNVGPQVSTARALLKYLTGESVFDPINAINDIKGIINSSCLPYEFENKNLFLIDEENIQLPGIMGYIDAENYEYYFFGEKLLGLNPEMLVTIASNDPAFVSPAIKSLADWYSSNGNENTINFDCQNSEKFLTTKLTCEIFPNPTDGIVYVNANYSGKMGFSIFSTTGCKVLEGEIKDKMINLSSLTQGCYFINIISDELDEVVKKDKIILIK